MSGKLLQASPVADDGFERTEADLDLAARREAKLDVVVHGASGGRLDHG